MSRIENDADPVAENIEEEETEQIANVPDMAKSIGTVTTEHRSDAGQNESTCIKCDALASRVIKLQKKISWLKKSKQKLNDSLNAVYIYFLIELGY